jgi:inhibitor of KinA sporulation pathway (predicted exonuclease)
LELLSTRNSRNSLAAFTFLPDFKDRISAPEGKRSPALSVEYLCVVDFEATCDDKCPKPIPQEILEFPAVLLNVDTGEVDDVFNYYIQPDLHPNLSKFCTELTGITQDMVNSGISLFEALTLHEQWLQKHNLVNHDSPITSTEQERFLYVT